MYRCLVLRFDAIRLAESVLADPDHHGRIAADRTIVLRPPQGRIALGDAAIVCVSILLFFHPR
jgi:hypothetical protein